MIAHSNTSSNVLIEIRTTKYLISHNLKAKNQSSQSLKVKSTIYFDLYSVVTFCSVTAKCIRSYFLGDQKIEILWKKRSQLNNTYYKCKFGAQSCQMAHVHVSYCKRIFSGHLLCVVRHLSILRDRYYICMIIQKIHVSILP